MEQKQPGRPATSISESEIRYAMKHTQTNMQAARFLNVSYRIYKKFAKIYRDSEQDKSLFDIHHNPGAKGVQRPSREDIATPLDEILEGKHPKYKPWNLKRRILRECLIPEECANCGFDERRTFDFQVPLLLDYMDGDRSNHTMDNLRFLCYNCTFILGHNMFGSDKEFYL